MERTINDYLDKLETLEDGIDAHIEKLFENIDMQAVVADPIAALGAIAEEIERVLEEEYHPKAFTIGQKFAGSIKENVQSKNNEPDQVS